MMWQLRTAVLGITFVSVLVALARAIFDPNLGKPNPNIFPATVPLPGWKFLASSPLVVRTARNDKNQNLLNGKRYQYIQNQIPLDVEMHYLVSTNGNTKTYIQKYSSIQLPHQQVLPILHQKKGIKGFYTLFTHREQAYLSACINPQGPSTVTGEQFAYNRNTYDLRASRLLPVLLGEDLRDKRCLWTQLATPLNKSSPDESYKLLEIVWSVWQESWSGQFPKF